MILHRKTGLILAALGLAAGLIGCGNGKGSLTRIAAGTYRSATLALGNGTARTYVIIGADGKPTSLGVVLTETAMENLPTAMKTLFEIPLPSQASTTPFNHIELRYWSRGHDPQDLFAVPHFDFIPFMMTPQERDAITAVGEDLPVVLKSPSIEAIPIGYAPIPSVDEFYAEPRYGTRYFDVASFTPVLNHEAPYTTTLFYGYYNGKVNFLEIPLTFPFLQTQPDRTFPIPLPQVAPKPGYYPTRYRVSFDSNTREYTFALEGMVQK